MPVLLKAHIDCWNTPDGAQVCGANNSAVAASPVLHDVHISRVSRSTNSSYGLPATSMNDRVPGLARARSKEDALVWYGLAGWLSHDRAANLLARCVLLTLRGSSGRAHSPCRMLGRAVRATKTIAGGVCTAAAGPSPQRGQTWTNIVEEQSQMHCLAGLADVPPIQCPPM